MTVITAQYYGSTIVYAPLSVSKIKERLKFLSFLLTR